MEEFGAIEDDYIDSNQSSSVTEPKNYKAFQCEPSWFVTIDKSEHESSQPIFKFKADYHFVKGNFQEAVDFYSKYTIDYQNTCLTVKRECLEGMSRSYLGLACYCYSLKYAYRLKELCSTFDSYSASYNLLFDCTMGAGKYEDAVMHCIKLVTLHSLNSDMWLKLGCAFGGLYKVPLFVSHLMKSTILTGGTGICFSNKYYSTCECEDLANTTVITAQDSKKGIHLIAMCLLHAEWLLKSVMGTSTGFAVKQNLDLQEGIFKDIESFDFDLEYLRLIRENVKKKQVGIRCKYDQDHTAENYDDGANSQLTNKQHIYYILNDINIQDFKKNWLFLNWNENQS